jgi:hypothetical protein
LYIDVPDELESSPCTKHHSLNTGRRSTKGHSNKGRSVNKGRSNKGRNSENLKQLPMVLLGLPLEIIELILETIELILETIKLLLQRTACSGYVWNQCHLVLDALEMVVDIVSHALEVVHNSVDVRLSHANFSNRQPVSDQLFG